MQKQRKSMRDWSEDDKPRERLVNKGAASLSNAELIALLINHGTRSKSALDVAQELLACCQNNLEELGKCSLKKMCTIPGIGIAKAVTIAAALEIGRRRNAGEIIKKVTISGSNIIANYLKNHLQDYGFEVFAVAYLNRSNKIKHFEIISKGGITGTIADPRIILKKAIELEACSIVLSHNHPSGNLKPSKSDVEITQKIKSASSYLDIQVLDHIIVSEEGYYSFADEGLL